VLLYDRVMRHCAAVIRHCGPQVFGDINMGRFRWLKQCQVYDLSSIMDLLPDWEREKEKPIPRRPPHDNLWAEWPIRFEAALSSLLTGGKESDTFRAKLDWRIGTALFKTDRDEINKYREKNSPVETPDARRVIDEAEALYTAVHYRFISNAPKGTFYNRSNEPLSGDFLMMDAGHYLWGLKDGGRQIECLTYKESERSVKPFGDMSRAEKLEYNQLSMFLPRLVDFHLAGPGSDTTQEAFLAWPMFFAFSLLHCRNIVTETVAPDEGLNRKLAKHHEPPRCSFRVLKIEVPHGRTHAAGTARGTGLRKRFHLCSGHFRELRSEQFVNKRGQFVWVTEHNRGDAGLGTVTGRRVLTPKSGE